MKILKCSKNIVAIVLLFAGQNVIGLSVQATERWSSPDYLLDSFLNIALNNEHSSNHNGIRKWNGKVKYYFEHHVEDVDFHEALTTLHLKHLSAISDIQFDRVEQKQNANLLVVFSTEDRMENELGSELGIKPSREHNKIFRTSVCMAFFSTNANGNINRAVVVIPVDRARAHAKLVSCIVEELTQVMGLPNDSEAVFPSIFNDKSYNQLLTGLDYLLLKMLYHPHVKSGMTVDSLRPILKLVLNEFDRNGVIIRAQERAVDSGLHRLLH